MRGRIIRRLGIITGLIGLAALPLIGAPPVQAGDEPAYATAWTKDHASRARLIAGTAAVNGQASLVAGVEIELDDHWKTYWRNPGTSGVPPRLEWTGSSNVAEATVLFPAPRRFTDRDGDTIGYKKHVVFPVVLALASKDQSTTLKLSVDYGVCEDVCVPVQSSFELIVPPLAGAKPAGDKMVASLTSVPRGAAETKAGDPVMKAVKVDLAAAKPTIVIDGLFPGSEAEADVFLEAPDGIWIPMPKATGAGPNGTRRFLVDLTDGADLGDLKGKTIRATLIGSKGQSEATFKLE